MDDKESIMNFVKEAKKYAEEFHEDWEVIFADMIMWSAVNMIEINPEFLTQLKEKYRDNEVIMKYKKDQLLKSTNKCKISSEVTKYRCWNKATKEMISWEQDVKKTFSIRLDLPECILMQFTGRYDKEGNEIYEGDIAILDNVSEDNPMVMMWNPVNAGFSFCPKDRLFEFPKRSGYYSATYNCRVIGNIYENQELLGGKNAN